MAISDNQVLKLASLNEGVDQNNRRKSSIPKPSPATDDHVSRKSKDNPEKKAKSKHPKPTPTPGNEHQAVKKANDKEGEGKDKKVRSRSPKQNPIAGASDNKDTKTIVSSKEYDRMKRPTSKGPKPNPAHAALAEGRRKTNTALAALAAGRRKTEIQRPPDMKTELKKPPDMAASSKPKGQKPRKKSG